MKKKTNKRDSTNEVEVPSRYKNITTSSDEYKTNRETRILTPITDVPDVNFDMPKVPDLPKLD